MAEEKVTKTQTICAFLETGEYTLGQVADGTGISRAVVNVYLSTLAKRGVITRTGNRGAYRYHRSAEASAPQDAAPVAVSDEPGGDVGESAGVQA